MNRWLIGAAVCVLSVAGAQFGQLGAAQRIDAVTLLQGGAPAGDNPGLRGATYYALEGRATRVTTRFADGSTAIAVRGLDGDLEAVLESEAGNELNRVRVDRSDGINDVVQFTPASAPPVRLLLDGSVHATLDWANRQSHLLQLDRVASGAGLHWREGVVRRRGAATEPSERTAVRDVETEWDDALKARTGVVRSRQGDRFNGRPVQGDVLVTTLTRDGVQIGVANYLTHERVFAWKIAGLTEGSIAREQLADRYGDWPFTPDMVWMNLQVIALHQWKTALDRQGFVARQTPSSPLERLGSFLAPSLQANEPGCDDLHWLDGTIVRFCCDMHDYCYEKYGCSSSSWWEWWSSWRCDSCNVRAVWCFASGGAHGPFYQSPW